MSKLLVAKVAKPQGIKGELKCQVLTDVLAVFSSSINLYIDNNKMKVQRASVRNGFVFIKFEGIDSRNDAEFFRNKSVYAEKSDLESFLQDEFLVGELIGMALYDENGNFVGQIVDYEDYGASGIFTIVENGHQYEVPFIHQIFRREGKTLVVNKKEYDSTKI